MLANIGDRAETILRDVLLQLWQEFFREIFKEVSKYKWNHLNVKISRESFADCLRTLKKNRQASIWWKSHWVGWNVSVWETTDTNITLTLYRRESRCISRGDQNIRTKTVLIPTTDLPDNSDKALKRDNVSQQQTTTSQPQRRSQYWPSQIEGRLLLPWKEGTQRARVPQEGESTISTQSKETATAGATEI